MRPAWQLATNSLSERRSRTILLIITVALCAGLIAAVSSAMSSLQGGIVDRVDATVGAADVRIAHVGNRWFNIGVLETARSWPETLLAVGRSRDAITLKNARNDRQETIWVYGIDPTIEYQLRPQTALSGKTVSADGQIALDESAAKELDAQLGDTVEVIRFGEPIVLEVVGIVKRPPLAMLQRPESYATLRTVERTSGQSGIEEIDIVVRTNVDPEALVEKRRESVAALERGLMLQPTAKITAKLGDNVKQSRISLIISSVLTFLAASFIIMTGLTTNVTERQRELAILRCIGGRRIQLAESQLLVGVIVGLAGALVGVPAGLLGAWITVNQFPEQLPSGFSPSTTGAIVAVLGSCFSGVLGATWPAIRASTVSPLAALASRAKPVRTSGLVITTIVGLGLVVVHLLVLTIPTNSQTMFWLDVSVGLPAMFTGFFLLSVPVTLLVTRVMGPVLDLVFRLPAGVLQRTVQRTPFRYGFTGGALMLGLALLIGIWTNGDAIKRDWLAAMQFPDGFVSGRNFSEATRDRIDQIPGVEATCAITLQPLGTTAFGVRAIENLETTFIAFEPETFFSIMDIDFIQGDKETAIRRLTEGNAIMVAKEFLITKGIGVGDTLDLTFNGTVYPFEIVGVVSSPGLDIVNKYFTIGDEYLQRAVNSVFGSRKDLIEKFGNDAIQLIQIDMTDEADPDEVINQVRRIGGFGILGAGSAREIKDEINRFLTGMLTIFSLVAIVAMLVACFGVANLIIAQIQARQFEFGVLRAIGAYRGQLARLVLGEALIIAITACIVGTVMGMQASWGGQVLYRALIGLELQLRVPWDATIAGWITLTLVTMLAAVPSVIQLSRRKPRELLGAMKG